MSENKGCNASRGCSSKAAPPALESSYSQPGRKQIEIEFLYLDRDVCAPCRGTENNIEEALAEVSGVLRATGAEVSLKKTLVQSFEQAISLGFFSSPTVRVGGRDLQFQVQESHCATCSLLSGTSTDCRVWTYQGREFQAAPKALIIEAVLGEVFGAKAGPAKVVAPQGALENLRRFFEAKRQKEIAVITNQGSAACANGCSL